MRANYKLQRLFVTAPLAEGQAFEAAKPVLERQPIYFQSRLSVDFDYEPARLAIDLDGNLVTPVRQIERNNTLIVSEGSVILSVSDFDFPVGNGFSAGFPNQLKHVGLGR